MQAILHKLLQKQAEERYQIAAGLIYDLRALLALLSGPEAHIAALSSFKAGQLDYVSTFRLSQKLSANTRTHSHERDACGWL